jgi:hypothetical protein
MILAVENKYWTKILFSADLGWLGIEPRPLCIEAIN